MSRRWIGQGRAREVLCVDSSRVSSLGRFACQKISYPMTTLTWLSCRGGVRQSAAPRPSRSIRGGPGQRRDLSAVTSCAPSVHAVGQVLALRRGLQELPETEHPLGL